MSRLLVSAAALFALLPVSFAQAADHSDPTNIEIVGHILQPKQLPATDDAIANLKLPQGFRIEKFAEGLINPRVLAIGPDGTLYATRRSVGDVIMLKDTNGDGKADVIKTVASRPSMHGIAIEGRKVYLVTIHDIYVADIKDDGTFSELKRIVSDLPDAGQHADRTLAVGADGMLYVSVGSTCNVCTEDNPENATILKVKPDGSSRRIFASGLRNTIGLAFDPKTGQLYGWDHGIDWLGDNDQPEEFNHLMEGKKYGWPYIYADGRTNIQHQPPAPYTHDDWARSSENPVLMYTPHAAPMQLAFYTGHQFPKDYDGDAFEAFHGSWNRKPPSGYEVVRIHFENGKPKAIEPFLSGFLVKSGDDYGYVGRPFGGRSPRTARCSSAMISTASSIA